MKINISILILLFFACSSNKQLQSDISNCNFIDKISEEEKVLNFKIIRDRFKENGYYVYEDNDSIHYSGYANKKCSIS